MVERIVSGGQTGVDRAALDVALHLDIPHGGWCPRQRLAEDGPIPARYHLTETESTDYAIRTEKNVIDSDGTLVLHGGQVSGGTWLTCELARRHRRPLLQINLHAPAPVADVRHWITAHGIQRLNIAGPRESSCPGIGRQAERYLLRVFLADQAS